jgi:hypothetical protein
MWLLGSPATQHDFLDTLLEKVENAVFQAADQIHFKPEVPSALVFKANQTSRKDQHSFEGGTF